MLLLYSYVTISHNVTSELLLYLSLLNHTDPTDTYTLSLHDALPIYPALPRKRQVVWSLHAFLGVESVKRPDHLRSEEHTSELQSLRHLVCRLLLEKKKTR